MSDMMRDIEHLERQTAAAQALAQSKQVKALRRYLKVDDKPRGWMSALSKRAGQVDVMVTYDDLRFIVDELAKIGGE